MKIKAVIFDMDGTVVDTTQLEYIAWKRMFDEQNVDFSYDEYIQVLGAKGAEIVKGKLHKEESFIEDLLEKKEEYFKELVQQKGLELIPDVEKVLLESRKLQLKLALATGASQEKLDFIMEKFNILHYFDAVVTADNVKNGKPDPEVFLRASEKLQVAPEECLALEDASNGVEAAQKANMACIAITSTRGRDQLEKADLIIDRYQDLSLKEFLLQQVMEK